MPDSHTAQPSHSKNRIWRVGTAEVDETRRELRVAGRLRPVEAKPLVLFEALLSRAGGVVTQDELLKIVWQGRSVVKESLTTAISKLRTALGDEGNAIVVAERGKGYRIGLPIELRTAPEKPKLAFTFHTGDQVPNRPQWCLDRQLGLHGSNDVWLARHEKTAEQRVFKFADTAERLQALKREAAVSRILRAALGDRSDLIPITEWNFETRPFFLESSYGGPDLPAWALAAGGAANLPMETRLDIAIQLALCVAAAHSAGVLHTDIKPSNVLIYETAADKPIVRLVDFGCSRLTEAADLHAVTKTGLGLTAEGYTAGGSLSGTFPYMAPEVLAGGPPTVEADIYALGICLFQLAVADLGRPLGAGWENDILDPLLREDIKAAASTEPLRRLSSATALVERLRNLDARRREQGRLQRLEQDAAQLARQIERVKARRPWLILALTALTLGLAGTTIFALRATSARDEARRQADIVKRVNSFLTDDLLGRGNPVNSGKANETLMEAAEKAEPRIVDRFSKEPAVAACVYAALALAFSGRSAYDAARIAYDHAAADFDQAEGRGSADATILRLREAQSEALSSQSGSISRAQKLIGDARPYVERLGPRSAEANVWLENAEGALGLIGGDVDAAQRDFKAAADAADNLRDQIDEESRFSFRQREAFTYLRLRQWKKADELLAKLLQEQTALHGPHHPDTLIVEATQANVLMSSGKSLLAIEKIDGILDDFVRAYGVDHRLTLQLYATRAQAEGAIERYDDAVRDDYVTYNAAVAKQGSHAFLSIGSLADIATSECRSSHVESGLSHALQSYEDAKFTFGERNAITQSISATLAFCLIMNGKYAEASQRLAAYDLKITSDFLADPDNAASISLLKAAIANGLGDRARARELLRLPLQAYSRPESDRYLHRWTLTLDRSLSEASQKN